MTGQTLINDKISISALKEYFANDETSLNIIDAQVVEIDGVAYWYDGEHGIATIETVEKEARDAEKIAGAQESKIIRALRKLAQISDDGNDTLIRDGACEPTRIADVIDELRNANLDVSFTGIDEADVDFTVDGDGIWRMQGGYRESVATYRVVPSPIISDEIRTQLDDGDIGASVCVAPAYFEEGDYTEWKDQEKETRDMTYEEYAKYLVEEMHQKYDCLRLHSNGCLYGIEGGTSHDISYNEFDDIETFVELVEKYGIKGTLEVY